MLSGKFLWWTAKSDFLDFPFRIGQISSPVSCLGNQSMISIISYDNIEETRINRCQKIWAQKLFKIQNLVSLGLNQMIYFHIERGPNNMLLLYRSPTPPPKRSYNSYSVCGWETYKPLLRYFIRLCSLTKDLLITKCTLCWMGFLRLFKQRKR